MTAELRRGVLLAILGLLGGLGAVAILSGTGLVPLGFFRSAPPAAVSVPPSGAPVSGPAADARLGSPAVATAPSSPAPSSPTLPEPARDAPARTAGLPAAPFVNPPTAPASAPVRAAPMPAVNAPQGGPTVPVQDAAGLPAPSFDVIRIEPDGSAVVAGRGAPGATVELLRDGAVFARALADPSGLFAFVPPPLPAGASDITLRTTVGEGRQAVSRDSVVVVVAPGRDAKPLVTLTSPDKPTVVLSRPDEAPAVASASPSPGRSAALPLPTTGDPAKTPPASQPVKVVSVEAEDGGRLFVSAQAAPAATVRLYLNDTFVAPGSAGADGRVTFAIGRGMRPGDYRVRIDQVDPVSGEVRTRSEVPFAFPSTLARAAPVPATTTGPATVAGGRSPGPVAAATDTSGRVASVPTPLAARTPAPVTPPLVTLAPVTSATVTSAPTASAPATLAPLASAPAAVPPISAGPAPDGRAVTAPPASAGTAPATPANRSSPRDTPPAASAPVSPTPASPSLASPSPATLAAGLAPGSTSVPAPPAALAPSGLATATPTPANPGAASRRAPETATVFVPELNTAMVTRGDTLWRISRRTYGAGVRYTVIYGANQDQIRNPRLIYPGQIFVLPGEGGERRADGAR